MSAADLPLLLLLLSAERLTRRLDNVRRHGVLPWRGPPERRRRIFSMRFHDAGGHDLSGYRKKKGQLTTADFAPWMQEHFSEESLELLLGQRKDETKAIAEREEIFLAPWEELYPPLEQPRL